MKLLLDTHVLLWSLRAPERLTSNARAAIVDRSNEVFVSAITPFEIATKARIGKLDSAQPLLLAWDDFMGELQATELALRSHHSIVAGQLDWPHRDPFDRILAAQSITERLVLVTSDVAFGRVGAVRTLWG